MSKLTSRFRVNEPDVIAESVDGEVLIINLRSGAYYSSDGSGDLIWSLLSQNASVSEVVDTLREHYSQPADELETLVLAFVEELEAEALIVSLPPEEPAPTTPTVDAPSSAEFVPPSIHKYTDFQELLLLDPIHEVDQSAGWPNPQRPR